MTLEFLPVAHGDAILVSCHNQDENPWTILIDTGPKSTWDVLESRLNQLPVGGRGVPKLDLFVITHIDHDHIGAAANVLNHDVEIGDVWFNGAPQLKPLLRTRSVKEGQKFSDLLGFTSNTDWNGAFDNRAAMLPPHSLYRECSLGHGAPTITLLGPPRSALKALAGQWGRAIRQERQRASAAKPVPITDLAQLADTKSKPDRSIANASSIVLLIEHRNSKALLLADAPAAPVATALRHLADQRRDGPALFLDVVKISHHGSKKNTSRELCASMQASHYVFTTDGRKHAHPDDETIARILTANSDTHLNFNYNSERNARWDDRMLQEQYSYTYHAPGIGQSLVIGL